MVGVLAVSAPLEDYTVQPCKKQRKDEDPPSKTITNYFSPLSKSGEKGLSSPKSSSIADYFIRSSPAASKEHAPSDHTSSPIYGVIAKDTPSTPPTGSSKPASRIGKRTKLIKRLSDVAPGGRHSGIMGSDTAALLADICGRTADLGGDDVVFQSESSGGGGVAKPPRGRSLKRRNLVEPPSTDPPNQPLPRRSNVSSESRTSGVDSSLEVHVDNTSDNPATLTISFEEFMKSQEQKDQSGSSPADSSGGDPKTADSSGGDPKTADSSGGDPKTAVSPKMVTVQAQVHLSPPLLAQKSTNIASIFKKQKVVGKKAPAPECPQVGLLLPKRRSNVVIQEEDLELAVIDVEHGEPTKQKSTPAERQQFMNAFRQAGDNSKPSAKKNPARKKDPKEATENRQEPAPDKAVTENQAEETGKPSKLKRKKKKPPPSPSTPAGPPAPLHCSPVLRRSLRRQKSPERPPAESPILMSTPKVRTPCRRSHVYKSEVLTVPSDTESPIRMRFTRVTRRSHRRRPGSGSDEEAFPPGCPKVSESSKKMSRAKQLLEKAKAIQQNLGKAETPQRRSTRQKSRGAQEPIVIPEESSCQKNPQKTANLRSLNDVLGKRSKTKSLPSAHKKEVKKKVVKDGVITIEDGSEVSENSQDDEQFKAKREFLLSGLPDSLKRQIARTSAMMEAYSVSGSSFQRVVHVQQRDGCPLWSLALPRCRLLTTFSPWCGSAPDIPRIPLSLGDVTCVKSKSAVQTLPALVTSRLLFSELIRDCLLEEIRCCNPQFPVRRFLKQFLTRQTDYLSLPEAHKSAAVKQIADGDVSSTDSGSGAKRKRKGSPGAKCKRRKASVNAGDEDEAQLPRSARRKSGGRPAEPDVVIIKEDATPVPEDAVGEDVLWTEKYQPQNSSELIGNSAAVGRLHSWLREWKIRAEKEEKRSQNTAKDKDETWNAGDFHDSEDSDEDSLCNTLLISGPPGVGKTAAVYACAQELGFKVFEVNASCQRSGRQILAQLREATQSHQVDQQGVNAHKPCFFSSSSSTRSPRKLNSPKRVVSSPRKPPVSPRGPGLKKGLAPGLAPKSLANFFKAAPKQKQDVKRTNAELLRAPQTGQDGKPSRPNPTIAEKESGSEESQRKTATSLILFEEVDVIFDDDVGFLSAIKTFMSTTKRPVILTSSDPLFGMMFDGAFEEVAFRTPSVVNVASFLQVLCLAENLRTDPKDVRTLVTGSGCDVRQSVLQLQFWARSGGGGLREKPLPPPDDQKLAESEVPGCSVGCAENLLGVNNIIAPTDGVISFLKEKIQEAAEWDKVLLLLAEFHSRNVYFTSSHLEFLLPLPVHVVAPAVCESRAPLPDDDGLPEDTSVKLSAAMKRRRKLVLLDDSDLFESDSVDEVLAGSTPQPEENAPPVGEVRPAALRTRSPASLLVSQCLDSMAEYADHMSSLDCSTSATADPAHVCGPKWTESRLRHGLCDGLRTDGRDWWRAQSSAEIRALMEALAFQKCSAKLSTALDSNLDLCKRSGADPTEELTLHVPQAREQLYFGQPATTTSVAERRLTLVKDVLSHRAFISLGNRDVNVTEYLPALRSICRLQKEKEEGKTKRRFLHYLEGIHLELPKATLSSLAADFP